MQEGWNCRLKQLVLRMRLSFFDCGLTAAAGVHKGCCWMHLVWFYLKVIDTALQKQLCNMNLKGLSENDKEIHF